MYTVKSEKTVRPTTKLRGNPRGKLQEGQGGLSGLSPRRSDGSHDSQAVRLDYVSSGQRQLKVS